MFERLSIKQTKNTPGVDYNPDDYKLLISGNSYPEDAVGFYKPIRAWLDGFMSQNDTNFEIVFQVEYFNTPTAKIYVDILRSLKEKMKDQSKVNIVWNYPEDDEDLKEVAERFAEISGLPFNYNPLKSLSA